MMCAAFLIPTLAGACESNPVIESDTACAWTRKIAPTEAQIVEMETHPDFWRSLAEQIIVFNRERRKHCQ